MTSPDRESFWSERGLERVVAAVLRWGVIVSAAVVALGGAVFLLRHGSSVPDYRTFAPGPEELRRVPGIVGGAARGSGRAMIQIGLLLLILTPTARVALSLVSFAGQRDRAFTVITLLVLGALIFGLVS